MKRWLIPLRSGGIIFLALVSEELIRDKTFEHLYTGIPYIVGVALAFVAIEYARIYKVQLPPTKTTNAFTPLVWG
jgi:hypothetical protein